MGLALSSKSPLSHLEDVRRRRVQPIRRCGMAHWFDMIVLSYPVPGENSAKPPPKIDTFRYTSSHQSSTLLHPKYQIPGQSDTRYVSEVTSSIGAMERLWDGTDFQAVLVRFFTKYGEISLNGRRDFQYDIHSTLKKP